MLSGWVVLQQPHPQLLAITDITEELVYGWLLAGDQIGPENTFKPTIGHTRISQRMTVIYVALLICVNFQASSANKNK